MQFIVKEEHKEVLDAINKEENKDILNKILMPKYSLKDLNIKSHTVINWKKEKIQLSGYDNSSNDSKRKKYNLIEAVGLKLIVKMKEFNIKSEYIKACSEFFWINIYEGETLKKNENFIKVLESLNVPKSAVESIINNLYQPFLELFVIDILLIKSKYSILFDNAGVVLPYKESYHEIILPLVPELANLMKRSHFSISINEAINDFIFNSTEPTEICNRLSLITPQESKIIEEARKEGISSINIRYNKDGKIELLEISKDLKNNTDFSKFNEILFSDDYKDIEIKTQSKKVIHIREKIKIKL